MIEDKTYERWKERARKLGLIVNMGVDKSKSGTNPKGKVDGKVSKKTTKK
jgi:hypothetical protein